MRTFDDRKISRFIRGVQEEEAEEELDATQGLRVANGEDHQNHNGDNDNDEGDDGDAQKRVRDTMLDSLKLGAYSIKGMSPHNCSPPPTTTTTQHNI